MKKVITIVYVITLSLSFSLHGMKKFNKKMTKNIVGKSKDIFIDKDTLKQSWRNYTTWKRIKNVTPTLLNKKSYTSSITLNQEVEIPLIKETSKTTKTMSKQPSQQIFSLNLPKYIQEKVTTMIKNWKPLAVKIADNLFFKATPLERTYTPFKKTTNFAHTKFHHAKQQGAFGSWSLTQNPRSPRPFATRAYSQDAKAFDYTLDGENTTLDPAEFVKKLHELGLTVADVIYKQCEKEEQKVYEEMKQLGILNDNDWKYLANILKARNTLLREYGHYNDNNITFKEGLEPHIVQMVKEALQRVDCPFKVTVHSDPSSTSRVARVRMRHTDVYDDIHLDIREEFDWNGFLLNPSHSYIIDFNLYLATGFFTSTPNEQKFILAHETTHLLNLHSIQTQLFVKYFEKAKVYTKDQTWFINNIEMDKDKVMELAQKHINIQGKIHEIQADLLPLAFPDYAKAGRELYYFSTRTHELYIPGQQMSNFAKRAVKLHEAEQELLKLKK